MMAAFHHLNLLILLLLTSLTTALTIPRQTKTIPAGQCCFSLHDTATGDIVQQDETTGNMYLAAGEPSGWYCLGVDSGATILRDNFYNACFLRPDAQFICLDPTPGTNKFTLADARTELAHDGLTGWKACPNTGGTGSLLWGSGATVSGCRAITLKPEGFLGTC